MKYFFGLVEHSADRHNFVAFTAHSLEEKRQALIDFVDHVNERRALYPDLHVFHYAQSEVTVLRKLACRHQVMVEELIEAGVMFDLYETVKGSLRISDRSFSFKKLNPCTCQPRVGVTSAVDSMVKYSVYQKAVNTGQLEHVKLIFAAIKDYNQYGCISTWKRRDWLQNHPARAAAAPSHPQMLRRARIATCVRNRHGWRYI